MKTKILITLLVFLSINIIAFSDGVDGVKETKNSNKSTIINAAETFKEAELKIESWMTDLFEFNKSKNIDESFEIEEWMISPETWSNNEDINIKEDEIILEDWMLKPFKNN